MNDDRPDHFATDHLRANLRGRSIQGGISTTAGQAIKFAVQLGSTMILARLLTPADFGLIAMVGTVNGLLLMFRDLGLSTATVQRAEIDHPEVSNLFWINIATCVALGLLLVALAIPLALFFAEPRLVAITIALGLAFPLGGLGIQHRALLRRQMRFERVVLVDVVALTGSVAIALWVAWVTRSYWALVAMPITEWSLSSLGAWLTCTWRPGRPRRGVDLRASLRLGGFLTGFNLVNYFAASLDSILIGRFVGAGALGLYSKALALLMQPIRRFNAPIGSVAIPVLARLTENDDDYRRYYRQGMQVVTAIALPIVGFCVVAADDIVATILGPQWIEVAQLFRLLAPAAFIASFNVATGWVYVSRGRTNRQFRFALASTIARVLALAIGIRFGIVGVALAVSISSVLARIPAVLYCFHGTPLRPGDLGRALWRPTTATVIATLATWLLLGQLPGLETSWSRLLVGSGLFLAGYLLGWCTPPGGASALLRLAALIRSR